MRDKLVNAAWWAFLYFYNTDKANAAIHNMPVKFSPITFRLAEGLAAEPDKTEPEVIEVMVHLGEYEEDRGR